MGEEEEKETDSSGGLNLTEKMKELIDLANSLDDLDKQAFAEIINRTETKTQEKLTVTVAEGEEEDQRIWKEIVPFVQLIRLSLASDTLSRTERCRLVKGVISLISGLLSPVELAGVCFTSAYRHTPRERRHIIVPFPFGTLKPEKKDKTPSIV